MNKCFCYFCGVNKNTIKPEMLKTILSGLNSKEYELNSNLEIDNVYMSRWYNGKFKFRFPLKSGVVQDYCKKAASFGLELNYLILKEEGGELTISSNRVDLFSNFYVKSEKIEDNIEKYLYQANYDIVIFRKFYKTDTI